MSLRNRFTSLLDSPRRIVHESGLMPVFEKLGLMPILEFGYRRYLQVLTVLMSSTEKKVEIADAEAEFNMESGDELAHISDLDGEEPVLEDLINEAESGDTFWDVGAHIGIFSCLIADKIDSENVKAFEPHPVNSKRLEKNVKLNNQEIDIRTEALSSKQDRVEFNYEEGKTHASMMVAEEGEGGKTEKVSLEKGDKIAEDLGYPDIVKIDVEGSELEVLKGMKQCLANASLVYIEVHPHALNKKGTSAERINEILENEDFEIETIHERGGQYFIKGAKK